MCSSLSSVTLPLLVQTFSNLCVEALETKSLFHLSYYIIMRYLLFHHFVSFGAPSYCGILRRAPEIDGLMLVGYERHEFQILRLSKRISF